MRALTLYQPWASLIAVGAKRIETRGHRAPAVIRNGHRFAIHAGKTLVTDLGPEFDARVAAWLGPHWKVDLPRGAVLATAVLADTVLMEEHNWREWPDGDEREFGEYAPGRWMWRLTEVERVDPPVSARGKQGLWMVDPLTAKKIQRRLDYRMGGV